MPVHKVPYDCFKLHFFCTCFSACLGNVKVKDMLINLLSRDKADEIQLAAAKWYYLLNFDFCNFHYLVLPPIDVHFPTLHTCMHLHIQCSRYFISLLHGA